MSNSLLRLLVSFVVVLRAHLEWKKLLVEEEGEVGAKEEGKPGEREEMT